MIFPHFPSLTHCELELPFHSLPLEAVHLLRRTDEAASIIQQNFRKQCLGTTFADVVEQALLSSSLVDTDQDQGGDEGQVSQEVDKSIINNTEETNIESGEGTEEPQKEDTSTFYMNVFVASFWLVEMALKIFGFMHRYFGQNAPQDDVAAAINPTTNTGGGGGGGATSGGPPGPPP